MDTITLLFTRRRFNPISWLIRYAVPRSRFALGQSSHCLVDLGETIIEASMTHGVCERPRDDALAGLTIVGRIVYNVPDAAGGVAWARAQLCTYRAPEWAPAWLAAVLLFANSNYDWCGALGLGLSPYRDWASDSDWFCYEFAAATLLASGRHIFANLNHVGETALMAINP